MSQNKIDKVRREVAASEGDSQERNRRWWESMPMTYADWTEDDRIPRTKEDFEQVDQLYLNGNPWLRNSFDFSIQAGREVLEIGCGSGSASCLFARAGARVSAIDLTEQAVELSARNAEMQELSLTTRRMDAEALEFSADCFDYVFSWGVIHHSQRSEVIIAEIQRVLKSGGSGMCMVYNRRSIRYYLYGLYWLIVRGKVFSGHSLSSVQGFYTDGFYQRHFTPHELRDAFAAAGLETERISITHMAKPMFPLLPAAIDRFLKERWGWLLVIEFRKPDADGKSSA